MLQEKYINDKEKSFILIHFSLFVKQAIFAYVNHAPMRSWNQPVLRNDGKVSCSRKQRVPLMGLELQTDKHPLITSRTRYPLRPSKKIESMKRNQRKTGNHSKFLFLCRLPLQYQMASLSRLRGRTQWVNAKWSYMLLYSIVVRTFLHSPPSTWSVQSRVTIKVSASNKQKENTFKFVAHSKIKPQHETTGIIFF